jgi:hypothetical protein
VNTVEEKGGNPDRKPYPFPYGSRNPYRNLKSENSQDYSQVPQRNCTFMNPASVLGQLAEGEQRSSWTWDLTTEHRSGTKTEHLKTNSHENIEYQK